MGSSPDKMLDRKTDPTAPASKCFAITPNDSTDIQNCRALWVETAGDIVVIFRDDTSSVTLSVPAQQVLPFAVKRVLSTGTTASDIFGLY